MEKSYTDMVRTCEILHRAQAQIRDGKVNDSATSEPRNSNESISAAIAIELKVTLQI